VLLDKLGLTSLTRHFDSLIICQETKISQEIYNLQEYSEMFSPTLGLQGAKKKFILEIN